MITRPAFHFHTGRYPAALYTVTEKYMNSISGLSGPRGCFKNSMETYMFIYSPYDSDEKYRCEIAPPFSF